MRRRTMATFPEIMGMNYGPRVCFLLFKFRWMLYTKPASKIIHDSVTSAYIQERGHQVDTGNKG